MADSNRPTFDPTDTQSAREAAEAQAAAEGILDAAGDTRRDNLALKAEKLIAAANKLLEQIDVEVADPANLEVDNEVRQALNDLNEVYVSNAQSEFAYAWQFRDPRNEFGGRYVRKMQALGYEVVSGDMPEAKEHKFVDGTRVVADCLLMRIRIDRLAVLARRDRLLRDAQQAGIVARVAELAERANTRLYDKLPGFVEEAITSQADQRRANLRTRAVRDFHRLNSGGKLDRAIREGRIPGGPVAPGAGPTR
jgi:hypothetical protein